MEWTIILCLQASFLMSLGRGNSSVAALAYIGGCVQAYTNELTQAFLGKAELQQRQSPYEIPNSACSKYALLGRQN
jgi:hypothetical protein